MEEFNDDDLYADVELQASTAISAMHRLAETRAGDGKISNNASGGEKVVREEFNRAGVDGGNHKVYENDRSGGCGLTNLPMENGDVRGSSSESRSESEDEDEDDLDSGGDDGCKQNCDNGKYDDCGSDVEFGVRNGRKREGRREIEEDEKRCGEVDGKEKSVNGGDCYSQRKNLKYYSLNSKKRRVDDMAEHVQKSCKKGEAVVGDDRTHCVEDNQPNFGRKYGGPNNACSRHALAQDPLPLDKCGSVQISDSEGDNNREVSDCDSDGMAEATETSGDTNRRETSSMSNKASSAVKPESSQSYWSQHARGSSCSSSPRVARRDKYMERSHKYSKHPSPSLAHENRPARDSKSHGIKRDTRGGRYYERQSGVIRKHSNQPKKSDNMPCLKTRWTNEDGPCAIDGRRLYNRDFSHGKPRAMVSFDSNENDMPYCSQSERFLTCSGGSFHDHRLGLAYLKNEYWHINSNCRYKVGWPGGHNMSGRQNFLEKSRKMGYEALEDDWYHNQRRHPGHGNIEGSRKLIPRYSSAVNKKGSQFLYEGDDMHFRRQTKEDYWSPLRESSDNFVEGKYRRICSFSGGDRNNLDHRFDQNIACDRREMESSRRGKRRCDSPFNRSDYLWHPETKANDRRNINYRPLYSSEGHCAPDRGRFAGAPGSSFGVSERNLRRSWKEMNIESGWYGSNIATSDARGTIRRHQSEGHHLRRRHYHQSSNTYITNESINNDCYEDHFLRKRHHQHSEALNLRKEVYKSRQQDDTVFHSEDPSYHFKRISRDDTVHEFTRSAKLVDEREANRHRSKMMREEHSSDQFDGCQKYVQPHSHAQMHPRYQESVDHLVVVGRKCTVRSSRRTSEAGEDIYNDRRDLMGWNGNQKSKDFEDSDDFHPEKALLTNEGNVDASLSNKNQQNKASENLQHDFLDIEEGQIITEEMQLSVKCVHASEDAIQISNMGRPETASNANGVALDDQKIREIMMKMERRRERFKESITTGRDCGTTSNPSADLDDETDMPKLERPARKRRWSGT